MLALNNIHLFFLFPQNIVLCGGKYCYKTQECISNDFTDNIPTCYCAMAIDCSSEEEWFCGSDGESYMNDCFSASKDCMSNTITRVHDGKCAQQGKLLLDSLIP